MESVLKFLFIVILIYYFFKVLGRWIFPFLVKRWMNRFQRKFFEQNPHINPDFDRGKEGDVNIKYESKGNTTAKSDVEIGDYVDFEEIKENNK